MARTTLKIRLHSEDLERWRSRAESERKSLSEWIRESCNLRLKGMGNDEGGRSSTASHSRPQETRATTTIAGIKRASVSAEERHLASDPDEVAGVVPVEGEGPGAHYGRALPGRGKPNGALRMQFGSEEEELDRQIAEEHAKLKIPRPKAGEPCQHGAGPGLCRYEKCHNHRSKVKR